MKVICLVVDRNQDSKQRLPKVVDLGNGNTKLDLELAAVIMAKINDEWVDEILQGFEEMERDGRVFMDKNQVCIYGDEVDLLFFREDMLSEVRL